MLTERDVKIEWVKGYHDGPLTGICIHNGCRYYFDMNDDDNPEYRIYDIMITSRFTMFCLLLDCWLFHFLVNTGWKWLPYQHEHYVRPRWICKIYYGFIGKIFKEPKGLLTIAQFRR